MSVGVGLSLRAGAARDHHHRVDGSGVRPPARVDADVDLQGHEHIVQVCEIPESRDPIAIVTAPGNELTLKLWSDQPGLQFYDAIYTRVPVPGLGGRMYGAHSGFCLEDQAFPDAVNHLHFPSILATPDDPYSHWCEFEIA